MANEFINIQKLTRDLVAIQTKLSRLEDIATTRALNIVTMQGRGDLVNQLSEEFDYPKNSMKRRIKPIKATRNEKKAGYFISSSRPNLAKPRPLKSGISHSKRGKVRVKVQSSPRPGSTKPFLVTATKGTFGTEAITVSGSTKKVAVYRQAGYKRRTTSMLGPSVPHMVEKIGIDGGWLLRFIKAKFPAEYKKQLKKAKYS